MIAIFIAAFVGSFLGAFCAVWLDRRRKLPPSEHPMAKPEFIP